MSYDVILFLVIYYGIFFIFYIDCEVFLSFSGEKRLLFNFFFEKYGGRFKLKCF